MTEPIVLTSEPTPGQFIREIHVWIATYPDGTEGIIAGGLPGLGMTPLMSSRRATATELGRVARACQAAVADTTKQMVAIRLVTFTSTEGTRQ